ncbi:MAG: CotH kinase family protein [Clostridiales bacterium]|nr:CotH kinase family protein [Clostridiales bacterium]
MTPTKKTSVILVAILIAAAVLLVVSVVVIAVRQGAAPVIGEAVAPADTDDPAPAPPKPGPAAPPRYPEIPGYLGGDALYAHGVLSADPDEDAWIQWASLGGSYTFFLPVSTAMQFVEIYNGYRTAVEIDGTAIEPGQSVVIPYAVDKGAAVTGAVRTTLRFMRSTTEGALYFNTQDDGKNYDPTRFGAACRAKSTEIIGKFVLADGLGNLQRGEVSKFRGRGNSTWGNPKKPFNMHFKDEISWSGLHGRKFTLLSNWQDATSLRNRMMYDMADELALPYSPASRFVDFYVNGQYQGTYLLCNKIALGKNSLISLKDNASDTQTANFNFAIELCGSAEDSDVYVTTTRRNKGVLKDPEPDAKTEAGAAQLAFIKQKYQQLEDALHSGSLDTLAEIADLDTFAKMYIVREFTKDVDGGYNSCFFTYDASRDKFLATPVWDFDVSLGNLANYASTGGSDLEHPDGMYVKNCGANNFLALFIKCAGAEPLVADIWKAYMPDVMRVLSGEIKSKSPNRRLQSFEEYRSLLQETGAMNGKLWALAVNANGFGWIPPQNRLDFIHPNLTTTRQTYADTFDGMFDFLRDWSVSRANWLHDYYSKDFATAAQDGSAMQPPVVQQEGYFVTGTTQLTGGADFSPNDPDQRMTYNPETGCYEKTYTLPRALPQEAGGTLTYPYRFRITNGSFDLTWGYTDIKTTALGDYITLNTSGNNGNINVICSQSMPEGTFTLKIVFDPSSWTVSVYIL